MATRDWVGVAAGLALAGFGLGAMVASGGSGPTAGGGPAVPAPAGPVEQVQVVETVVLPAAAPEIPGVSAATARLLADRGYADASGGDLGLSSTVIRVLEANDVVLLVPGGDRP